MYGSVRGTARKGGSYRDNLLCEAPFGPFRQKVPDPFFPPRLLRGFFIVLNLDQGLRHPKLPFYIMPSA